jgi:hypothetical protein
MSNGFIGNMIVNAFKKLFFQTLKLIVLIAAFFIESAGKLLIWFAEKIKQNVR